MAKDQYPGADLYQLVIKDAGKSTARELAKSVSMKEPNFLAAIAKYALESKRPLPKMAFEKSKTTVKSIHRRRTDCDIRISHFRLDNAGMGDMLSFKMVAEPDHPEGPRLVLIEDTNAPKATRGKRVTAEKLIEREKVKIDRHVETAKPTRGRGKAQLEVEKPSTKTPGKRVLVSK
jgi:hypothetical protein